MLTRLPLRRPLCAWRHWTPRCPVPRNVLAPRSRWRWALPCCLASWVLLPKATGAERHDFGRDRRDPRLVQCEERTVKLKSRSAGHGKQLVVLVHGLDSWSGTWQALMELLAKRGVPTLALDLRGHGESPLGRPEDFSPEQLAADVRAAVKAQGPGSRIALVGHSMGGRIAMQYAADYPEDLNLLVIEDMDCVPRSYPVLEGEKLKNCQHFSREFQSSESARKTLISFGYDADRVDGWFVGSPPRVYEKDGKIWSCINPFAQYLAKQTVLNSVQGQRSLQQIAAWKTSGANFAVHVCVAGRYPRGIDSTVTSSSRISTSRTFHSQHGVGEIR